MTTSDGWLFLSSFIVTYNFTGMQKAFTGTGLLLGFYGGLCALGWVFQIFFMPETKNKTLEEIDLIFQRPTMDIVRENAKNNMETARDLMAGRFKKVFIDNNRTPPTGIVDTSDGKTGA
ncbi:hypothetical protein KC315_g17881 [Hortaea werneckii]|nr:hypothetical protein KC315_g17881 [Hortaea werneckii]